jgi:glycosyltransferase involved in cell wall biosynthesis
VVVGVFGPARIEKGFHRLPDIVEGVIKRLNERDLSVRFVIQCTPQKVGYSDQVRKAIEKLDTFSGHVLLLHEPLSDDLYFEYLSQSDVVLLPYGQREYRFRSSGVVAEARAFGKLIVATEGTYPGIEAEIGGGGVARTNDEFSEQILNVAEKVTRKKNTDAPTVEMLSDQNDVASYIRRCLSN